jgi:hypothetical protein
VVGKITFWEDKMARSETQEESERVWFRRLAMAILVVSVFSGGLPLVKEMLFPVVRTR